MMAPPLHPPFIFHLAGFFIRFLFIFGGAFFLLRYYLKTARKALPGSAGCEGLKIILPLRLQAYERIVLFLERIHPSNLVLRLNAAGLTAQQFQSLLARTIREEFEYNLSQQLYVSDRAWELSKNAKEETIAMINQATSGMAEEAGSAELVQKIFDLAVARGKLPVETALEEIKRELQQMF